MHIKQNQEMYDREAISSAGAVTRSGNLNTQTHFNIEGTQKQSSVREDTQRLSCHLLHWALLLLSTTLILKCLCLNVGLVYRCYHTVSVAVYPQQSQLNFTNNPYSSHLKSPLHKGFKECLVRLHSRYAFSPFPRHGVSLLVSTE